MLETGQKFTLPFPAEDITSGGWLHITPANDRAIKNIIRNTSIPYADVVVDTNTNTATVWLDDMYYNFSLYQAPFIEINGGAGYVQCDGCPFRGVKEEKRDVEPKTIIKSYDELKPFFDWAELILQQIDEGHSDYIFTLPSNVKSLMISWIKELGDLPMNIFVIGALLITGRTDVLLEKLNLAPQYYYELLSDVGEMKSYHIEQSAECYNGAAGYSEFIEKRYCLYYGNYPEKNFDTVVDDLEGQVNCEEFGPLCVEGNNWTQNIDGKIYLFEPTSEVSADVKVIISGWGYQTSATVETDGETGNCRLVVSEVTYYIPDEEELEPTRDTVRTVATNWGIAYEGDYSTCDER